MMKPEENALLMFGDHICPQDEIEKGVKCPFCKFDYTWFGNPTKMETADIYKDPVLSIPFHGECGHNWYLLFEFHKGCTGSWIVRLPDTEEPPEEPEFSYPEYLASDEWKAKAAAAKKAAGMRCQVCNAADTILDTHHRTYERIGNERPEDLIVLCRDCHALFHENGRLARV